VRGRVGPFFRRSPSLLEIVEVRLTWPRFLHHDKQWFGSLGLAPFPSDAPLSLFRRWFAWAFLIATIVVQGPHDHCQPSNNTLEASGTCEDQHSHWAGHEVAEQDSSPDFCPICQHRLQHLIVAPTLVAPVESSSPAPPQIGLATLETGPRLRSRCRAPPSV